MSAREEVAEKIPVTDVPVCMKGEYLHWRVLHAHIKERCKKINGFVRLKDIVEYFIPIGVKRDVRNVLFPKVAAALHTLETQGYITKSMGVVDNGACIVLVYLKDVNRSSTNESTFTDTTITQDT